MPIRVREIVLLTGAVVVAACGSVAIPATSTPSGAVIEEGAALYAANCASCHGERLEGTSTGPPFLSSVYEPGHHGDGAFLLAVTRGVPAHHWPYGDMPPVEGLSAEDVAAIVAHVRDVQEREGFQD